MKRVAILLLTAMTIIGGTVPALASDTSVEKYILISTDVSKDENNNNLIIDGKNIEIGKLGIAINNGQVMIPLKITAESLGFKVNIDKNNKVIILDNDEIKTEVEVGVDNYYYASSHAIGMTKPEKLGAEPIVIDNTIYAPIKIYNLLFNDSKAVGSFWSKTKDGQSIYIDNGNLSLGWKPIDNKWYFMDRDGFIKKGWLLDNGKWYFLDSNGVMQSGIIQVDGKIYYLGVDGAMQIGNVDINGETYSFAISGEAIGSKIPQADKVFSTKNGEKLVEINLEGNPTTGCSWEYSIETEGIIKEDSNEYKADNTEVCGSGGMYTWKFSALKEGVTEITFKYVQPCEKEKVYETKTYIFTVDEELNISIKEK